MSNAPINPKALDAHPLCRHLPPVDLTSAEYKAIESSISERGIDNPILITTNHEIVDGRHRWTAALALGMELVPVRYVDCDAAVIILGSLMERRHLTAGARAYLAIPLLKQFIAANSARYSKNLKSGKNPRISRIPLEAEIGPRMPGLASRLGLSEDVFDRGRKLHAIYAEDPEYKAETEPKLLAGEVGLGALIAGHAGRRTTAGKNKAQRRGLELFASATATLIKRFSYWADGDPAGQKQAWTTIREAGASMPAEQANALANWFVKCAGELRKEARHRRQA